MEDLELEEGAQVGLGGNHARSGEAGLDDVLLEPQAREEGSEEEEEGSSAGDLAPGGEVEFLHVGHRGAEEGRTGAGTDAPLLGSPSGEAGLSLLLEDVPNGGEADRLALGGEGPGDVGDAEPLATEGEDRLAQRGGYGSVLASAGDVAEEGGKLTATEAGGDDLEGARSVAEPSGGLGEGELLVEEGTQGLVAALEGVGGTAEEPLRVEHGVQYSYNNNNLPVDGKVG
ncbi:MAG: hypothetical protein ACYCVV_20025 [Acidimicrobiales bacterium]